MLDGVDLDAPIEIVYDCFHQTATNSQHLPQLPTLPPWPIQLDAFWPSAAIDSWFIFKDYLKIYLSVKETAVPNYLAAKIPIPPALKIEAWRAMLQDYPDIQLIDHLKFGWPLDYYAIVSPPVPTYINHAFQKM